MENKFTNNKLNNMNNNELNNMNNNDIIINDKINMNKMIIDEFTLTIKIDIYKVNNTEVL